MNEHRTNVTAEDGLPESMNCTHQDAQDAQDVEVLDEQGRRVDLVTSYEPHRVLVYRTDMRRRIVFDAKDYAVIRPVFGNFVVRRKR